MTTTIFNPDAHTESTSVDGDCQRGSVSETFSTIRAGAGTSATDSAVFMKVITNSTGTTDRYDTMQRAIVLFDTSALGDADTIASATLEFVLAQLEDPFGGDALSMVTSTPASDTAVASGDYAQTGTTKQAADLALSGLTSDSATFNAFTLNATGLGNISKTGISKFAIRTANDIAGSNSWSSSDRIFVKIASAEETLSSDKRPKLVVVHTSPFTPKAIMF